MGVLRVERRRAGRTRHAAARDRALAEIDAALAALSRAPGRPLKERNWELEAAHAEIGALTEAIKAQAIELGVIRGKSGWG